MTSALIFPRSRKIGRIVPNARFRTRPKPTRNANAKSVIVVEILKSTTSAIAAVSRPPANSTRPVPIRFRTPSTSVMMRDTSAPVLFAS